MSEFNDYKWYDDDYSKNIPAQESNESFSSGGPTFTVNQKKEKSPSSLDERSSWSSGRDYGYRRGVW